MDIKKKRAVIKIRFKIIFIYLIFISILQEFAFTVKEKYIYFLTEKH